MTVGVGGTIPDGPAPYFDRTVIARSFQIGDPQFSYIFGFAAGSIVGAANGFATARGALEETAREEGAADGAARGLARGLAIGAAAGFSDGYDEGSEDGAAAVFPIGISAGAASVSTTSETTPPAIGTVSPDAGEVPGSPGAFPEIYADARDVPIVVPVADAASVVKFVAVAVLYFDTPTWHVVYLGDPAIVGAAGFRPGYQLHSAVTGTGAAGVGWTLSIRNDGGWPGLPDSITSVELDILAVDAKGNVLA